MTQNFEATSMRDLLCGSVDLTVVGERVSVCGWVAKRREHGEHLAFLDLRDRSGVVQAVVDGSVDVRSEYVLRITGTVSLRPEALRFGEDAPAGWPRLQGIVASVEMLGPITRLDMKLANGTIVRMASLDAPQRTVRDGEAVTLAYDPARLTVVK